MRAEVVPFLRRHPEAVFGAAAAFLVPWIVVLALTQPQRGVAENLEPLRLVLLGAIVALAVGLLVRAVAAPLTAALLGGGLAGFTAAGVWFDLVTRVGLPATRLVTRLGVYTAVTGMIGAVTALLCLYRGGRRHLVPRVLLGVALAVLVLEATSVVTSGRLLLPVDNLDVAWVGLDVGELVGLTTLAVTVRADRRAVVVVGPATAALLFSDAAINVLTAGDAMSVLAALGMAVAEIGLGVLAVAVAVGAVRRRRVQPPGPPPLPDARPEATAPRR